MDNLYSLNEVLSISDEVIHESDKLCQIIRDKVNQEMKNMNTERYAADDGYGKYIIIHFKHNFFNLKFKIDVKNYISINENYLYRLGGNTKIGRRQMTLEIKIDNPKYFEDIVTHEILHIFQYNKNQKKYEIKDDLYKILSKIRKNIENICDNLYLLNYKQFEERDIIDVCKNAYWLTLEKDKTINVEAFVDNLAKVFSSTKIL